MQVLRSSNAQTPFPPGSAQRRLVGVQYQGPPQSRAVVVWSASLIERAGAITSLGALLLRKVGGAQGEVAWAINGIPRLAGSTQEIGSAVILDLAPGDGLELLGFMDNVGSFDLQANGLTVVVL